jgi:hypothetical protein
VSPDSLLQIAIRPDRTGKKRQAVLAFRQWTLNRLQANQR